MTASPHWVGLDLLTHVADRQPLMYLAWLESARRGHKPCAAPACPLCNPIRELAIPLPEELEEVAA
jgi:hypothetical protein